jgi:hypothetical protein
MIKDHAMTDDPLRESRNTGTFAALLGLVVVSLFLLGIAALVVPQILGVVAVIALFLGIIPLHYVVWGWWLPKVLRDDDPPDPDRR